MSTPTEQFDFVLPPERIAQTPAEPRDHSRLMVLDRSTGAIEHRTFFEIGAYLKSGDVLVMNDTKVFKARLRGKRFGKEFEVFLLRPLPGALEGSSVWHALVRPGKLVHEGNFIELADGVSPTVARKREDGSAEIVFPMTTDEVLAYTDRHGEIPVPPYVNKPPATIDRYQTVYARETGSVAAPTAGFHFTPELIEKLKGQGIQFAFVTLHVGLGTFRPVKTATLEEHEMHSEFVRIDPETALRINAAKKEGRRIVAVGTTTVRALEGTAALCHSEDPALREGRGTKNLEILRCAQDDTLPIKGFIGDINLFITPGFKFNIIDALITNFHLPKSTLLVLVSAFAGLPAGRQGREHVLAAYREAIEKQYRFYSFGDAMFIH